LKNKIQDFKVNVAASDSFDIICLVETWLDDSVSDLELSLKDYDFIRSDRNFTKSGKSRAGGLLIYFKKSINFKLLSSNDHYVENVVVKFTVDTKLFILSLVYLPPASTVTQCDSLIKAFSEYSQNLIDNCMIMDNGENILLLGDFNLPGYNWNRQDDIQLVQGFNVSRVIRELVDILLVLVNSLNLKQNIISPNSSNVFLDLMFSNVNMISCDVSLDPLCKLDLSHFAYTSEINTTKSSSLRYSLYSYNFNKGDYTGLSNAFLNFELSELTNSSKSLDYKVNLLYKFLNDSIEKFVPKVHCRDSEDPSWFTYELRKIIKLKNDLHRQWKQTGNDFIYDEFRKQRSLFKYTERSCRKVYISGLQSNVINNPRKFWAYAKLKDKKMDLPGTMHLHELSADTGEGIVNLFSDHFKTIYSYDNEQSSDSDLNYDILTHKVFDNFNLSFDEVLNGLLSLKDSLSAGPDDIPVVFIKNLATDLTEPLLIIFNESLSTGLFPSEWGKSLITPVYKKGARDNVLNYRPIMKISLFAKVFDKLVATKLQDYFLDILSIKQHAYLPRRSTVTNLLEYSEYLVKALDSGKQVDCLYTDLKSAFDKVNYNVLSKKLLAYGVNHFIVQWLCSFMGNREISVKYKNFKSIPFTPESGVAQGSNCGPLIFIIYINDILSSLLFANVLCYADDLKIFAVVNCPEDAYKLQNDIDILVDSFKLICLEFNPSKCKMLTFFRKNADYYDYSMNGIILSRVTEIKDLGVTFDENLTFETHINVTKSSALKRLYFIFRFAKDFTDVKAFTTLYICWVRSLLLYASQVWSPYYINKSHEIEAVQHKFYRLLSFKIGKGMSYDNHNYSDLANYVGLPSLHSLRDYHDILFLYRIIHE